MGACVHGSSSVFYHEPLKCTVVFLKIRTLILNELIQLVKVFEVLCLSDSRF